MFVRMLPDTFITMTESLIPSEGVNVICVGLTLSWDITYDSDVVDADGLSSPQLYNNSVVINEMIKRALCSGMNFMYNKN